MTSQRLLGVQVTARLVYPRPIARLAICCRQLQVRRNINPEAGLLHEDVVANACCYRVCSSSATGNFRSHRSRENRRFKCKFVT